MKYIGILFIMSIFCQIANCQEEPSSNPSPSDLFYGVWQVDLRPTKESEPYFKEFEVGILEGNSFSGTFYETAFYNGLINAEWERLYFAFSTEDASNHYYHSGYILDGKMFGLTYCPERGFTMPWTGSKLIKE